MIGKRNQEMPVVFQISVYRSVYLRKWSPLCRAAAAGRLGFSRGEAVAKMGTSEPIFVTDVECGQ